MYNFDFSVLLNDYKAILNGIYTTIYVSFIASILAFCLGVVFTYFRTSPKKITHKIANFCISCIRNTPLLIVIYLFYKGLPSIGIVFSALACGILALGLYTGAYISDAILSGINAIPQEHLQASRGLGFTRLQAFRYIILPQALRHSIFILGSQFMNLIKNSSLVSFISVTDIFYVVYNGISNTYRIYEYFIMAIILYCCLTWFVLIVTNLLQRILKIPSTEVNV